MSMGIDIKKRTASVCLLQGAHDSAYTHGATTHVNAALDSYRQYPEVINKLEWIATNDSATCVLCRETRRKILAHQIRRSLKRPPKRHAPTMPLRPDTVV